MKIELWMHVNWPKKYKKRKSKTFHCRIPAKIVHLCNIIWVVILKMKDRKNEKPKFIELIYKKKWWEYK
jgi:hypothetical protein